MTFVGNDVVLIVDDSKFIAQAYSRVLLGLGYRVLIARNGSALCAVALQTTTNEEEARVEVKSFARAFMKNFK